MKLTSFRLVLLFSLFVISCGSNDAEKFVGTWSGNLNCGGDSESLVMTVMLGASDDQVLLEFEDTPMIKATVDGDDITLETTSIPDGGDFSSELAGSGSINGEGNLVMNFVVEIFQNGILLETQTCTVVLTM